MAFTPPKRSRKNPTSFRHYSTAGLRGLVRKFNKTVGLRGFTKMSHDQLLNHLEANFDLRNGAIVLKRGGPNDEEDDDFTQPQPPPSPPAPKRGRKAQPRPVPPVPPPVPANKGQKKAPARRAVEPKRIKVDMKKIDDAVKKTIAETKKKAPPKMKDYRDELPADCPGYGFSPREFFDVMFPLSVDAIILHMSGNLSVPQMNILEDMREDGRDKGDILVWATKFMCGHEDVLGPKYYDDQILPVVIDDIKSNSLTSSRTRTPKMTPKQISDMKKIVPKKTSLSSNSGISTVIDSISSGSKRKEPSRSISWGTSEPSSRSSTTQHSVDLSTLDSTKSSSKSSTKSSSRSRSASSTKTPVNMTPEAAVEHWLDGVGYEGLINLALMKGIKVDTYKDDRQNEKWLKRALRDYFINEYKKKNDPVIDLVTPPSSRSSTTQHSLDLSTLDSTKSSSKGKRSRSSTDTAPTPKKRKESSASASTVSKRSRESTQSSRGDSKRTRIDPEYHSDASAESDSDIDEFLIKLIKENPDSAGDLMEFYNTVIKELEGKKQKVQPYLLKKMLIDILRPSSSKSNDTLDWDNLTANERKKRKAENTNTRTKKKTKKELAAELKQLGVKGYSKMSRDQMQELLDFELQDRDERTSSGPSSSSGSDSFHSALTSFNRPLPAKRGRDSTSTKPEPKKPKKRIVPTLVTDDDEIKRSLDNIIDKLEEIEEEDNEKIKKRKMEDVTQDIVDVENKIARKEGTKSSTKSISSEADKTLSTVEEASDEVTETIRSVSKQIATLEEKIKSHSRSVADSDVSLDNWISKTNKLEKELSTTVSRALEEAEDAVDELEIIIGNVEDIYPEFPDKNYDIESRVNSLRNSIDDMEEDLEDIAQREELLQKGAVAAMEERRMSQVKRGRAEDKLDVVKQYKRRLNSAGDNLEQIKFSLKKISDDAANINETLDEIEDGGKKRKKATRTKTPEMPAELTQKMMKRKASKSSTAQPEPKLLRLRGGKEAENVDDEIDQAVSAIQSAITMKGKNAGPRQRAEALEDAIADLDYATHNKKLRIALKKKGLMNQLTLRKKDEGFSIVGNGLRL